MLKIGVVGIGGYAGNACEGVLDAVRCGDELRFVAACEPRPETQPKRRDQLIAAGIPIVQRLDELLMLDLDAVWLPIPIPLHRPFTEQSLAAGKAVLVEKPAAGSIDDVDAMIRARDRSGLPVAIGFQTLFDPNAWRAKELVLDGAIGEVRSASVLGCWPRSESYYARASWAGRIRQGDAWVLDSPLSNALAHYANLALFLMGDAPSASAAPVAVEAELYRAYAIEMFETCTVRAELPRHRSLTIALTHACRQSIEPTVTLHGSRGNLQFSHARNRYELTERDGRVIDSFGAAPGAAHMRQTLTQFARLVKRDADARYASLENARCHTLLVNAVSEAAEIFDVPEGLVDLLGAREGSTTRAIRGIESLLETSAASARLLSELPQSPLHGKPGRLDLHDYRHFAGPRGLALPASRSASDLVGA